MFTPDTLLSTGLNFIGGLLGNKEKGRDREAQMAMANQNIALQKDFAQQGIRWKVADARAAGLHPLAALGANTMSFSPVSIASDPSSPMGDALKSMGSDISRAQRAGSTKGEQLVSSEVTKLQLEGMKLDNDIKKAKLASDVQKVTSAGAPKPIPEMVPEADKFEERPKLMAGGDAFPTDPGASNADDFEKRYGEMSDFTHAPQIYIADELKRAGGYELNTFLRRLYRRLGIMGPSQEEVDRWVRKHRRSF